MTYTLVMIVLIETIRFINLLLTLYVNGQLW